jgi:hypothetical protein
MGKSRNPQNEASWAAEFCDRFHLVKVWLLVSREGKTTLSRAIASS